MVQFQEVEESVQWVPPWDLELAGLGLNCFCHFTAPGPARHELRNVFQPEKSAWLVVNAQ